MAAMIGCQPDPETGARTVLRHHLQAEPCTWLDLRVINRCLQACAMEHERSFEEDQCTLLKVNAVTVAYRESKLGRH